MSLSAAQLERAGRIWNTAHRAQCEGWLIFTDSYIASREMVQNFALMRWEQFGARLQEDLAAVMFAFVEHCNRQK
jgi:hypothetical protein